MICDKCGKESNNLRVCPFCHTPYPEVDPKASASVRATRATKAVNAPRPSVAAPRQTATGIRLSGAVPAAPEPRAWDKPAVRWGIIGGLAVGVAAFWFFFVRERTIPTGEPVPDIIASTMSDAEAAAVIRTVNATAQVDSSGSTLTVRVAAAIFPERRDGQMALVQQYTHADALVHNGHQRPITFLDGDGKEFAKADSRGVVLTR